MTNEVENMKKIINKMPKNLNEAIDFEADEELANDMNDNFQEEELPEEIHEQPMQQEQHTSLNVASFVDDIRKKSLKGMAELADNPESPDYQLLKKIWQICDKKPEQEQPAKQIDAQM